MTEFYNSQSVTICSQTLRLAVAVTIIMALLGSISCRKQKQSGFRLVSADHATSPDSKYPVAADPLRVGSYEADSSSGAGYFYDDVLEYRVWLHPEQGAKPLNGNNDYFLAFAQYERAEAFSKTTTGAEEPLVLVRQREWIDEPRPGEYHPEKSERITEWQVKWLADSKRGPTSIYDFMLHPKPAGPNE